MPHSSQPSSAGSARLKVESLEDRTTPTFLTRPTGAINVNNVSVPAGGLSLAAGNLLPDTGVFGNNVINEYVTGTGPGIEANVRVWAQNGSPATGTPLVSFNPFPGFQGGINVAVGDVVGDGTNEIIVSVAASGPPAVKVFTAAGQELASFFAFNQAYQGGVNIAVGNVLGGIGAGGFSGGTVSSRFKQEIIIGAATNSSHVVVTDTTGTYLRSFLAFPGFNGGVTVAAANIDTTRDPGFSFNGPIIRPDNFSYDEIIVGAASMAPHVKAFEVWKGPNTITERLSFMAFDPSVQQGVTVAAGSTNNNRGAEIYVSQITATATTRPKIRAFSGAGLYLLEVTPYPTTYTRVVNMVVANVYGSYDPSDDNTAIGNSNTDFLTMDLAMVTGDGSYQQQPRTYRGSFFGPAGTFGP